MGSRSAGVCDGERSGGGRWCDACDCGGGGGEAKGDGVNGGEGCWGEGKREWEGY